MSKGYIRRGYDTDCKCLPPETLPWSARSVGLDVGKDDNCNNVPRKFCFAEYTPGNDLIRTYVIAQ